MLKELNLLDELCKEEEKLLRSANELLETSALKDLGSISNIRNSGGGPNDGTFNGQLIFSEAAIRNVCTDFRLRCLPSKYYKKDIPYEALMKINEIERSSGSSLKEFCIVAPAEMFSLEDSLRDPILLAPIENGKYLFIHKWGRDLSAFRKIVFYPFRTFSTFIKSLFALALLLTAITPWNWIVRDASTYLESAFYYRIMLFGCVATWIFVITFYFGFVTHRNFSADEWNNRYFN